MPASITMTLTTCAFRPYVTVTGTANRKITPAATPGDAGDGADHPAAVRRHDETAIAHRRAVLWPATLVRLVTRWQNSVLVTPIIESHGLKPSAEPGASQVTSPISDSSINDKFTCG